MKESMKTETTGSEPAAGFRESAVFTLTAVLVGLVIELYSSGKGIVFVGWPFNLIGLILFGVLIFVVGVLFRERPFVKWFGGIPMGLSLIFCLALLSLIGGVVPQDVMPPGSFAASLRLNGMFSSWPFAFVTVLFLFNLGLTLVWKTIPFRPANLQFMLFHGGFWLALACGLAGATQLQRLAVPIYEGRESNKAYNREQKELVTLPFSIYLKDFQIDQYVPQYGLYDPKQDRLVETKSKLLPEVRTGVKAEWPGVGSVAVLDYLHDALPGDDGVPVAVEREKGVPFAKVRIEAGGKVAERWISSGGPEVRPQFVPMGEYVLVMLEGAPKAFRSEVTMIADDGERKAATLEVNKPVDFKGWKLYQASYDEQAGRWSTLSLVEVIRDPWLPAVYVGFFMIMAGNVLFFWKGLKKMEEA